MIEVKTILGMTRKQALAGLIENVEAGEMTREAIAIVAFDIQPILTPWRGVVADAYSGSLDAASDLHEAVLPGWGWQVFALTDCDYVAVLDGPEFSTPEVECPHNPARAWLLAILSAIHAQEPE